MCTDACPPCLPIEAIEALNFESESRLPTDLFHAAGMCNLVGVDYVWDVRQQRGDGVVVDAAIVAVR
jgi:hypothetical protein